MRGMRGRSGPAIAVAVVLGLVALAVSTAVVVAVAGHRPPAAPVGSRPQPAGGVAPAGQSTSAAEPSSATSVTRGRPRTVQVDETTESVTVPVGSLLEVRLHGTPDFPWRRPESSTPRLLERLSASTSPDGGARGSFRAIAAGDAVLMVERSSACSSGPTGGVCGAEAHRIAVTVTA